MKTYISFFFAIVLSISVNGQALFAKHEFCKKKEVEIITGDSIPFNYVLVGTASFNKSDVGNNLESLTNKQLAQIRKWGKFFKSCKMFVDFKAVIKFTDGDGNDLSDRYVSYYALIPYFIVQ
jgi:hypothetical protein